MGKNNKTSETDPHQSRACRNYRYLLRPLPHVVLAQSCTARLRPCLTMAFAQQHQQRGVENNRELLDQLEIERQGLALERQVLEQKSQLHRAHVEEFNDIHRRSLQRARVKLYAQQHAARNRNAQLWRELRDVRQQCADETSGRISRGQHEYDQAKARSIDRYGRKPARCDARRDVFDCLASPHVRRVAFCIGPSISCQHGVRSPKNASLRRCSVLSSKKFKFSVRLKCHAR